jgi:glutamate:GABA antiporter
MLITDRRSSILRSERIAGGILPKVLNSFDMLAIFVAIVLWIPNAATVTKAGPAAFIYWGLGFITCLIPGAIVTGQLGLMFPGEGSIYVWTTKAFGNLVGFLGGFCAWWPGILVIISGSNYVVTYIQSLENLYHLPLLPAESQGLVIILLITISFLLSILRFRLTQNLVNVIFLIYGSVIILIGVAGVVWLITPHKAIPNPAFQSGNLELNSSNFTFYGTVILALLGIEVPLNMGVEIKDTRSITRYLLWGSVVVMIAYLIVTFGVMAVPTTDQTNPSALVDTIQMGFGGRLGLVLATVANLFLIGFFVFVCAVYNYSYARLLFVSGLDRRLPIAISKINGNKVPWIAVLAQSALAALLAAFIFILAPTIIPKVQNVSNIMSDILLAAAAIVWSMSMIFLFLDVAAIRRKFQAVFARTRLAPDWVFTLCSIVGIIANGAGIVFIFTYPWVDSKIISTGQWDALIVGITIIALIVAVVVFFIGKQTIRKGMSDEELIAEVTR